VLRLGGGGGYLLQKKKYIRRKKKKKRGDEGWSSGHKLNITNNITDEIILSVTPPVILLVKISCHHMICLFESHCNTLHHSSCIYRENVSIGVYRWIQGWKILSVKVIATYRKFFFFGVSICIYQFSGSEVCQHHISKETSLYISGGHHFFPWYIFLVSL